MNLSYMSNMNLENMEHVYKYYIHHGVSIYLVASRDPACPTPYVQQPIPACHDIWQVTVKNLYSPGKDLGFGSCPNSCNKCYSIGCRNNYCICQKPSPIRPSICAKGQIQQKIPGIDTGIDRSASLRMTTVELANLMHRLDTSNGIDIKQGNIILY